MEISAMPHKLLSYRIERFGVIFLLIFYLTFFLSLYFSNYWGANAGGYFQLIDFGYFWLGARAVVTGSGGAVYDLSYYSAAQVAFFGPPEVARLAQPWWFSPNFLLYMTPFGLLSFQNALVAWICSTFCVFFAGLRLITARPFAFLVATVPCAVAWNIKLGQTGFLAAGLIALSLGLMADFPFIGGMILGLLTYKPQFGLLFPVVLVASGQWRVIAGAAVTTILLIIVTTSLFGIEVWPEFLAALSSANPQTLMPNPDLKTTLQTPFGLMVWIGCGTVTAWVTHGVLAVPTAILVCLVWRRPVSFPLKAAALSAGALIVTPYLVAYDLVILEIPAAFLIKEIGATGFLRGERQALLAFWALPFLYLIPIGPVAVAVLFGLVLRRAFRPGAVAIGRIAPSTAGSA
jgi:arabinofuranan 3-O-arabinosyltransferase